MPTCYFTCPSWVVEGPEDHARLIAQARRAAALIGAKPVMSPLTERFQPPESWLPVADRIADLEVAFAHDVIWPVRGGHGAIHLLPALLARRETRAPLLVGYSDITVFHALWRAKDWGETWYGAVNAVEQSGRAADTIAALAQGHGYERHPGIDPGVRVLFPGRAEGTIVVGCLAVLAWLVGTAVSRPFAGCILAIEDIELTPFMADYALHQLYYAGLLDGVAGLIAGGFTSGRDAKSGATVTDIIAGWARRLRVPAIGQLAFGHVDDGMVVPNGRRGVLTAGDDGRWLFSVQARGGPFAWSGG